MLCKKNNFPNNHVYMDTSETSDKSRKSPIKINVLPLSWFHLSPEGGRDHPRDINDTEACLIYSLLISLLKEVWFLLSFAEA